jgi:hypothetical protein
VSAWSPPRALGFSGAAALDGDGKFAGIALLKPMIVAGAPERRARGTGGAGIRRHGARVSQGQAGMRPADQLTGKRRWCA